MTKFIEVIVKQIVNYRFNIPVEWVEQVIEGDLYGDTYILMNGVEVPNMETFSEVQVVLVEKDNNEVPWEDVTQEIVDKNTYE